MSLFWKILLGFWLSLLLMALGAGAAVTIYNEAKLSNPDEIAKDKRAIFILELFSKKITSSGVFHLRRPNPPSGEPPFDTAPPDARDQERLPPGEMPPPGPPDKDAPLFQPGAGDMPPHPDRIQPLVVDAKGKDLFGRTVPVKAWS